jgi:hypothetical protein
MKSKIFYYDGNLQYDAISKEWLNYENGGMGGGGCRKISTENLLEEIEEKIVGLRRFQVELLEEKIRIDNLTSPQQCVKL